MLHRHRFLASLIYPDRKIGLLMQQYNTTYYTVYTAYYSKLLYHSKLYSKLYSELYSKLYSKFHPTLIQLSNNIALSQLLYQYQPYTSTAFILIPATSNRVLEHCRQPALQPALRCINSIMLMFILHTQYIYTASVYTSYLKIQITYYNIYSSVYSIGSHYADHLLRDQLKIVMSYLTNRSIDVRYPLII